jgi:hypothetical protein
MACVSNDGVGSADGGDALDGGVEPGATVGAAGAEQPTTKIEIRRAAEAFRLVNWAMR